MIDKRVLPEDHFDFMSVSESTGVELYKIVCALNRRTKLGELVWEKVTEENHDLVLPCNSKTSPEVYECSVDDRKFIFRYGGQDSPFLIIEEDSERFSFNLINYTDIFYTSISCGLGYKEEHELANFFSRFKKLMERFIDTIRNATERERFRSVREFRLSLEGGEVHVREFDSEVEEDVAQSKDLYGDAGQYAFSVVYEK